MKTLCPIFCFFLGAALTLTSPITAEEKSLYPISVEGKWGYIDNTGQVVIEPKFLSARYFSEGLAIVEIAGTTEEDRVFERTYYGFIKPDGKFAIPPEPPKGVRDIKGYHSYSFDDFHDGLARVHINDATGMDGYIDVRGKVVISPQYGTAGNFAEGLAYVDTQRYLSADTSAPRRGFINKQGNFVVKNNSLTYSYGFAEGRAYVSVESEDDDRNCALIDRRGNFVISPGVYDALDNPRNGAIRAVKDSKVGLLDRDGEIIVAFGRYDQILEPSDGSIFVAEADGNTFLLDSGGKHLAQVAEKGDVGRFQNGFATIERDGHVGYIDATGSTKIPMRYDKANPFKQGLALVTLGRTRGYINRAGDFVWKTDRWNEPLRNVVSKPLSTFLPKTTVEALPLSYNWQGVNNAIVFVANGRLDEIRAWYRKRCTGNTKLTDHTDFESEPGKIDLMISRPGESFLEVFAADGDAEVADGFVSFYSCKNMDSLRKKHSRKVVGIVIEN